jgi:hypothetical protein
VRRRRETCDGYQRVPPPGVGVPDLFKPAAMSISFMPQAREATTSDRTSSGHDRGLPRRMPVARLTAKDSVVRTEMSSCLLPGGRRLMGSRLPCRALVRKAGSAGGEGAGPPNRSV